MPLHEEPNGQKADSRHMMQETFAARMEAEARAQAAELPPTGKPVAPPATVIPQRATSAGQIRFG